MKSTNPFSSDRNSLLAAGGWKLFFLLLSLLCVFGLFVRNSSRLMKILNTSTEAYLEDVTFQNSRRIEEGIKGKMNSLESIADSLAQFRPDMNQERIEEFLSRKAKICNFHTLLILDREQNFIMSNPGKNINVLGTDNFFSIPGIQRSFEGSTEASYTKKENIFYSTPIVREGKINEIVIGVRDKKNMLELISAKNFEGQMISCIVDHTGGVVMSPFDMTPFLELEDIFSTAPNSHLSEDIAQVRSDMEKDKNGILRFSSVTGKDLFLSYNVLNISDWYLLTIIPANILSSGPQLYILQSFLTSGLIILVFLLLFYSLLRFYRSHKKELEKIAYCDPITGGLNNAAFQARYREAAPSLEPGSCAIVLLNVIGFKLINEQFGMEVGNQTLSSIHRLLSLHLKKNEFLARGESDYFFLFLMESTEEAVQKRLDAVIADINSAHNAEFSFATLGFKRGACLVDEPEQDIAILQEHARLALLKYNPARRQKCAFYDDSLVEQLKTEQEMNYMFASSLENHSFQVYLQPKIHAKTRKLMGAEALVRWNQPEKGMIPPSEFIPLFESNGKICQLDFYVFREICATIHRWKEMGIPLFPISVNLSRQHFTNEHFLEPFFQTAQEYGIPDNILEFELTESIFFESREIHHVKQIIGDMHDHGFLCSLDDFGSGFSSLGLLKEFDVDSLKLDRCFFRNMANQKAKDVIICLINLAKCLDVQTVAEGIEDMEQVEFLSDMNCDMIQGFVFSCPIPIEAFEKQYLGR